MHSCDPLDGEDLASVVKRNEGVRFAMGNSVAIAKRSARIGSNLAYLIVKIARLEITFKFCLKIKVIFLAARQVFRHRCPFFAEVRGFYPCNNGSVPGEIAFSQFRI